MATVTFPKNDIQLSGLLYTSTAPTATTTSRSGLVVVHPGGGVKEQTASTYASALVQAAAAAGETNEKGGCFAATLAFDAAHQGASGGTPRLLEDPASRVADVRAAIDYLQQLRLPSSSSPDDDDDKNAEGTAKKLDKIFVLGICAGSGYAVAAAAQDHRVAGVACVSAVNIGDAARHGWAGGEDSSARRADLDGLASGVLSSFSSSSPDDPKVPYVPWDPVPGETPTDLAEASAYYTRDAASSSGWDKEKNRGARHPRSPNAMLARSAALVLAFDAWHLADALLAAPALAVVGAEAGSRWHTDRLVSKLRSSSRAPGEKEKPEEEEGQKKKKSVREVVVEGARHMCFYDDPVYVGRAVAEIDAWARELGA